MEFQTPHYKQFITDFQAIAQQYGLDPNHLKVEFYAPQRQGIFVEEVDGEAFKIHINLEDNRIISVRRVSQNGHGNGEHLREKYRKFMK